MPGNWLFKGYLFLKNYQTWPDDGGWYHQTEKFIKCVELCDLVNLRYAKIQEAQDKLNAKRAKAVDKALGKGYGKKHC